MKAIFKTEVNTGSISVTVYSESGEILNSRSFPVTLDDIPMNPGDTEKDVNEDYIEAIKEDLTALLPAGIETMEGFFDAVLAFETKVSSIVGDYFTGMGFNKIPTS